MLRFARRRWLPIAASCCLLFLVCMFALGGFGGRSPASHGEQEQQPRAGPSELLEPPLIIYNRVPKTGSTSFVNLLHQLCKTNHFFVSHVTTTRNSHVLNLANQVAMVRNLTNWKQVQPLVLHGHFAFVDFQRLGSPVHPLYINVVRDPLQRLVSYFYFLRFGDDFRPHLIRRRMRNKQVQQMTFDECVNVGHKDCSVKNLWMQVPFFCGHAAYCWQPGNQQALRQAKRNLVNRYFLVGITEQLGDFFLILEASLPRYFSGLSDLYATSSSARLRRTTKKQQPTAETVAKLKQTAAWKAENEFYEFAKAQFRFVKKKMLRERQDGGTSNEQPALSGQTFTFQRLRPQRRLL